MVETWFIVDMREGGAVIGEVLAQEKPTYLRHWVSAFSAVELEEAAPEMLVEWLDQVTCVCDVGVQECSVHPGRLMTKEQKIEFRKWWDAQVEK